MPKIIAIIHARGGSQRIPLKNIKKLNGKPLIFYPIQLAKSVNQISRIIVSTDHSEIKKISEDCGAEVPFVRPKDISEDVASELVTKHTLDWLASVGELPDIAVTITPATPFTRVCHLESAISMLIQDSNLDSVVSVRKAKEFPQWMVDLDSQRCGSTPFGDGFDGENNISQNLKQYYYPLGAFFVNRVATFIKNPSMYGRRWSCIEMNDSEHVDIDIMEDWINAEKLATSSNNY
jgi:CMP-N-acetylneuraminic acid synthetase